MTRINLLPWREALRKERKRQFASIAVGAVVLMGAIVFYAHVYIDNLIAHQNARNKFLQDEIAKVDESIKEIRELESAKKALLIRMNVIQDLQSRRPMVVHMLDELVRAVPEGLYLTKMEQIGHEVVLEGKAQSNARVSAFMRRLDASDWFDDPRLDVIQVEEKNGERSSKFILTVMQVNPDEQKDEKGEGGK